MAALFQSVQKAVDAGFGPESEVATHLVERRRVTMIPVIGGKERHQF